MLAMCPWEACTERSRSGVEGGVEWLLHKNLAHYRFFQRDHLHNVIP